MSIELDRYAVKITLVTPMLGTAPANGDIYEVHIMNKAKGLGIEVDEVWEAQTVPELEEKGMTVFRRQGGDWDRPFIPDYMLRGFFKAACGALRRGSKTESSSVTSYKKVVDTNVFIAEREVLLSLPEDAEIGRVERPLRADTPQGPRTALACSESAPEATTLAFTVEVLSGCKVTEKVLREWLDYGRLHGLGQWRGGGYGRFTYEIEKLEGKAAA